MSGSLDVTGYAIVSDDDKIAGADGLTPTSLRNEKDWELYQRAQEVANLVVFARRSHELEPNVHRNVRLVVSREAPGLERRPDGWWWDPRRVTWEDVAAKILPKGGVVAVGGGRASADVDTHPALGHLDAVEHAMLGVGVERGGDHEVDRQHQPRPRGLLRVCESPPGVLDVLGAAE